MAGKNNREIGGLPLVAHSIVAAMQLFQGSLPVYVSTDSQCIGLEAVKWGAKHVERPAEYAQPEDRHQTPVRCPESRQR